MDTALAASVIGALAGIGGTVVGMFGSTRLDVARSKRERESSERDRVRKSLIELRELLTSFYTEAKHPTGFNARCYALASDFRDQTVRDAVTRFQVAVEPMHSPAANASEEDRELAAHTLNSRHREACDAIASAIEGLAS